MVGQLKHSFQISRGSEHLNKMADSVVDFDADVDVRFHQHKLLMFVLCAYACTCVASENQALSSTVSAKVLKKPQHNALCLSPPPQPPPPHKILHKHCFVFSWDHCKSYKKLEIMLMEGDIRIFGFAVLANF